MFLGAWCLGGMVPTLGAWSEVRSQWLGAAIVAAVLRWVYHRDGMHLQEGDY